MGFFVRLTKQRLSLVEPLGSVCYSGGPLVPIAIGDLGAARGKPHDALDLIASKAARMAEVVDRHASHALPDFIVYYGGHKKANKTDALNR